MWVWRCGNGETRQVKWEDKLNNEDVLMLVGERRGLLDLIHKRKNHWIGHVTRHPGLLRDAMEGRLEGNRGRGRKRIKMLDDIMGDSRLYGE